jgi:hypothetical protein
MRERNRQTAGTFMRGMVFAVFIGTLAVAAGEAAAGPAAKAQVSAAEISAQSWRRVPRLRVYPGGRLLYRDCTFRLAQQWRPSGTVIVPVQRCWWVRG